MTAGKGASRWAGRTVLITAGPTREYLDPVRFLTNASSGMMGFALAKAAKDLGAKVILVCGPCRISVPWGVQVVGVVTGEQMHKAVLKRLKKADVVIAAAAVGDWKFAKTAKAKIKKTGAPLQLTLLPNPDIIADVSRRVRANGRKRPVLVGFALETTDWLAHAREKLERKGLDLIVANQPDSLGMNRARVAVLRKNGRAERLPTGAKPRVAAEILKRVEELL